MPPCLQPHTAHSSQLTTHFTPRHVMSRSKWSALDSYDMIVGVGITSIRPNENAVKIRFGPLDKEFRN